MGANRKLQIGAAATLTSPPRSEKTPRLVKLMAPIHHRMKTALKISDHRASAARGVSARTPQTRAP